MIDVFIDDEIKYHDVWSVTHRLSLQQLYFISSAFEVTAIEMIEMIIFLVGYLLTVLSPPGLYYAEPPSTYPRGAYLTTSLN